MSSLLGGINQSAASALTGGGTTGVNTITGGATPKAAGDGNAAVTNFLNYMKETPAQRMEDAWLAAHGLTQKDLDSMSADKRQAIIKQMADDIKRQVQQATQNAAKKAGGANSIAAAVSG